MPNPHKSRQKRSKWIAWLLLALLCVGITELVVCAYMDPALFQTLTAPAVHFIDTVHNAGNKLFQQSVSPPEPEPTIDQAASEPEITVSLMQEDPKVTEFCTLSDREILTGGTVDIIYFNQGEEPWASQPYGPDEIKGYGCGPTALAMFVSSLTDCIVTPTEMAQWAFESGYCAPGSGSYLSIVEGAAQTYGLQIQSWQERSPEALCQALATGQVFVALMGPGHFTSSGHFILLRGVTLQGTVLVADPNSRERSLVAWDPELILSELSDSRVSGAALWCCSALVSS